MISYAGNAFPVVEHPQAEGSFNGLPLRPGYQVPPTLHSLSLLPYCLLQILQYCVIILSF